MFILKTHELVIKLQRSVKKNASLVFLSGLNVGSALLSHFPGQNLIVFAFGGTS